MNKFYTEVNTSSNGFCLRHDDKCMMLGACFTEHVGTRLLENKFQVDVNPFGVLYNPCSIFSALDLLLTDENGEFPEEILFCDEQLWHSWMHSSLFSAPSKEELIEKLGTGIRSSRNTLKQLDVLFLTFGTNHAYYLREKNKIVANCHKQRSDLFEERVLSVEEIVGEGKEVLKRLFILRPDMRVVFTVSPYRYAKYGFHGNQLSKATLLLAIQELAEWCGSQAYYFPAYEILNDELRDYRFYADDMLHPSAQAIEYIWQAFLHNWISEESRTFIDEWQDVVRSLGHRPFNPSSRSYHVFLEKILEKIAVLHKKYPNFAFESELSSLRAKLDGKLENEK